MVLGFVIPAEAGTQRNKRKIWVPWTQPSTIWGMVRLVHFAGMTILGMAFATTASAQDKKPPYWASIASGEAMMRTGPGRNYPGTWLYKRRDLPIRVIQVYPNWRKIEDPDGEQGWMLVTLLSDRRTGIVKPGSPRDIRTKPDANAPVRYRAEHGVVGRLEKCDGSWCRIQIGKRQGWIAQGDIWGVGDGEIFE